MARIQRHPMQATQSTQLKFHKFLALARIAGLIQANGLHVLHTSINERKDLQLNCYNATGECIPTVLTVESFEEGTWYEHTFVCDDSTGNPVQVRFFELKPI